MEARKIRIRLGGGPSLFDPFPDKPKGMHLATYDRLREAHDVAMDRSMRGIEKLVRRLDRQNCRPHK